MEVGKDSDGPSSSSVASIPTRICMSPPSSMSTIGSSAAAAFATTRHGYKQMLAWMRSFGQLQRVGIEATGTYGAGLLRYLQKAGVEVLEVTTPDKQTAASAARTMISMPRTPPMPLSPASAPSRPRAATA